MRYTFNENSVNDLHKNARGFHPTQGWLECWNYQDEQGKQAAWNVLIDELNSKIGGRNNTQEISEILSVPPQKVKKTIDKYYLLSYIKRVVRKKRNRYDCFYFQDGKKRF
jgi:Fic family protein